MPRLGEPVVREVDRDDPLGSGQPRADDRAEPDEPTPEDDTGRPGLDARGVERCADTGREAAGEWRAALERRIGRDLRERDLGHHRVLGERRRAHEVAQRLSAEGETRGAVREVAETLLVADGGAAIRPRAQAMDALTALRGEERHDVVALRDERHIVAHPLDDACALVPSTHGAYPLGSAPGSCVEIRVADAARDEPDEHFAGLRLCEVHILDDERLPELLEHGGADLHAAPFERWTGRLSTDEAVRSTLVLLRTSAHGFVTRARRGCADDLGRPRRPILEHNTVMQGSPGR